MVTLATADKALKSVYLGVLTNQFNVNTNPLFAKIKKTSTYVTGKEVIKTAPIGINGGIGAGTEDGALPASNGNTYAQMKQTLKNLYGTIEISDKAIRASQNDAGVFVNLLNAEMDGLIKASTFNFSRMLMGNGKGYLAEIESGSGYTCVVDAINNLIEGMVVDVYDSSSSSVRTGYTGVKILSIDRANKKVTFDTQVGAISDLDDGGIYLVVQNSVDKEIFGLDGIFDTTSFPTIYSLSRAANTWLNPTITTGVGALSDAKIQSGIDTVDEYYGSNIDFITCSSSVKRAYQTYLASLSRNIDVMNLEGGFKAISYAGIPIMSDRFMKSGTMYLLNSNAFTLHQLCDWEWLEGDDGSILKQKPGYACFSATLVKYAELMCDQPCGQVKLAGITV